MNCTIVDSERNEEARRVRFQQPGVSLGRGVQNFSSHGVYSYPVAAGDTESETEVATISAAITAREISDLQNQALAAASIYPDSSLPTYSQGYEIINFAFEYFIIKLAYINYLEYFIFIEFPFFIFNYAKTQNRNLL